MRSQVTTTSSYLKLMGKSCYVSGRRCKTQQMKFNHHCLQFTIFFHWVLWRGTYSQQNIPLRDSNKRCQDGCCQRWWCCLWASCSSGNPDSGRRGRDKHYVSCGCEVYKRHCRLTARRGNPDVLYHWYSESWLPEISNWWWTIVIRLAKSDSWIC